MNEETWAPLRSKAARLAFGLFLAWAILWLGYELLLFLRRMIAPLQGILVPVFIGLTIAWILDPVADRLERIMPRAAAVGVIVILSLTVVALLLAFIIPVFMEQASTLLASLPDYFERFRDKIGPWAQTRLAELEKSYPVTLHWITEKAREALAGVEWSEVLVPATSAAQTVVSKLGAVLTWIVGLLIVPIIALYLLLDFDQLRRRALDLAPPRWQGWISERAGEVDKVLGSYVRGYGVVCTALAIMYSVGLAFIGVPLWLVIGIIGGLFQIIPYVGFTVSFVAALAMTVAEFGLDWWRLAAVLGVYAAAQFIESWILTPNLVGGSVGLRPLVVLLAVVLGGQIFGIAGMFLAVPATAVGLVFARDAMQRYRESDFYKGRDGSNDETS